MGIMAGKKDKDNKDIKKNKVGFKKEPAIDLNLKIPRLVNVADKTRIDARYALIVPYVSCHAYWNKDIGELVYEVEEPLLGEHEKSILESIEKIIIKRVNSDVANDDVGNVLGYLDKVLKLVLDRAGKRVSEESYSKLFYHIYKNVIGYNEIGALMNDKFIKFIECNGINSSIYINHRIFGNMRTNIVYYDITTLAMFVKKLALRCGRYISDANPLFNGILPDGSKVNATYTTNISSKGSTFTIKKS